MADSDIQLQFGPSRWLRIIPILLLHGATLLLVMLVLTTLAFGFHDYYRHANIEIPAATVNVIRLAEIFQKFSVPIFIVAMLGDFALMVVLTSKKRTKRWPLSALSQIFIFVALVVVVYSACWLGNPIIWSVP